ncbi:phosphate ABC transporter membrane protein 1, PhoT family [Natronoarchaeum philippinense]|uniref:Phosphate transport system permease protein n=1 Tax=Natronoarchaeum philippinense TaxID=558529 RepID=A0A285NFP1_NATPI|nr:phosphate ABC transporter permease subunit PstC [Natronoarchaeum philippinense]SNZ06706.1 phosphate ABC transporter membrane protein 1, PhoT family [Natronoarchaeum philippinense]
MSGEQASLTTDGSRSRKESAIKVVLFACAALSVLVTGGIILTLGMDAIEFFTRVSPVAFFTGTEWSPVIKPYSYGVLPLILNTLLVTVLSALIALPVGLAAAIYLSEYASDRMRSIIKPGLEILAGIPTVVYGYFALVYITPFIDDYLFQVSTFNALSASIMVGVMIIPMVSSISEDALSAVPDELRQAGYGMGATKFEVSTGVVVPAAVSGIFSSFILGISRAIGETMIVVVAAGQNAKMIYPGNIDEVVVSSIETMTVAMVKLVTGELSADATQYKAMFAIGLTLFVMTFALNLASSLIEMRYREEYK